MGGGKNEISFFKKNEEIYFINIVKILKGNEKWIIKEGTEVEQRIVW